ncbi:beta-ketoacyl synthase N-terminal-like domain-containing protein [Limosilactobacillus reuteri]|uniref:3-oxoacyl-ACP synthase n=1 Tax=Limosilactobacillus reuteri TaxID=1598 RepID=A0AAX2STN7_LIMRT|nr:beta-ketoacyl synthase N-terminal-like domain-containing protein [Limosilactobacillus reuteri]RMX26258.1 3-oxoacyl-ACP synthase [Limosilactobacillus reuteri]TGB10648.1 3-oxoacyl-ACP synthase [Limosilactobacillus reuteri]
MTAVIVGIGITSSCGESFEEINENISQKKSGISKIDYFDTSELTCNIAGNLTKGIWKEVLKISNENKLDWSSSLSIYTIRKLLKNYQIHKNKKIGLSLGTCNGGIHSLSEYFATSNDDFLDNYPPYIQSKDISKYFNFNGPKYSFNSACAASANAIAYGAEMINNGDADIVVTGGCDPMSEWVFAGFNSLRTFNNKNCMPYGEEYGLNLGEAATYFLIEDKKKAIEAGHKIYAEILGHGLSNDAHHPTAPDKDGFGIAYAIRMALRNSGLAPKDIIYVNSHGTGTKANDSAEYRGFKAVFKDNMPFISSMKGYVGHNLGAAASTELAISLIGMNCKKILYPNFNLTRYRNDCNDDHILKEPISLAKYEDINFINNNAAFGGQNVAVVFHVNLNGKYISSETDHRRQKPIYINNFGMASSKGYMTKNKIGVLENSRPLKSKYPELYKRRMNMLTQISIIAAKLAMQNQKKESGLVYGTPFGSMSSTLKYVTSIQKYGFKNASGAYFPDLVINSTAGHICQALSLRNYSSSISSGGDEDLRSLIIAHNAINRGYVSNMLVGAGQEETNLGNKILKRKVSDHATFLSISNKKSQDSIAAVENSGAIGCKNKDDLLIKLQILVEKAQVKNLELKIKIQNNSQIPNDELLNTIHNLDRVEINNKCFADGNFKAFIDHSDEKQLLLIGISQINDISFAKIKNY